MVKLETKKLLAAAVAAAESKQAVDLRIWELDPAESSLTDFFLVMSGTNPRQIQTLADEIELRLKRDFGEFPNSREGYRQAEWVLLDYVDFIVHIFSEEKRAYYGIERLRKSMHRVTEGELTRSRKAVSKKAASAKPVGKKTVSAKTVGKNTAGAKPASKKPAGKKSPSKKPANKKPASKKAISKKSVSRKPAARKAAKKPSSSRGKRG